MSQELKNQIEKLKSSDSREDRKACIPLLQEYLTTNPTDTSYWYELAACYEFLELDKEAEPYFWKTYELGWKQLSQTDQTDFFVAFSNVLRNNFKFEESEMILREAIENFPKCTAFKVFLALTLYSMGRFKESSQNLFLSALEMPPKSLNGYEKVIEWYVDSLEPYALGQKL